MRAANGDGLETVVIRPRFVWGRGDLTLLPALVEMVRAGRFRLVGGREFVSRMLETQGVTPPSGSVPAGVAGVAASVSERLWRLLRRPGSPPLTRFAVWVSSQECTIDIGRAEHELGYRPIKTREQGLAELAG